MKIDFFEVKRKYGQPGSIVDMGTEGLALVINMWIDEDRLHVQVVSARKIGRAATGLLTFDRQQADQIRQWRRATAKEFSRELQRIFDEKDFSCSICGELIAELTTAEIVCPGCQHDQAAPVYIDLARIAA